MQISHTSQLQTNEQGLAMPRVENLYAKDSSVIKSLSNAFK